MRGVSESADVLQETNLTILKHAGNYDSSRPFLPWARGVARKCVLKFYSAKSRDGRVIFDNGMIDTLAERVPCAGDDRPMEDLVRLRTCMAQLLPKQRDVIAARYMRGEAVKDIAAQSNCSESAVSVLLHRVRQLLADCVARERKRTEARAQ